MENKFKLELVSFAQTFVSVFIVDMGLAISQLPIEDVMSGTVFTVATLTSLVLAAARSAIKVAWQKFMPVKFGGVSK